MTVANCHASHCYTVFRYDPAGTHTQQLWPLALRDGAVTKYYRCARSADRASMRLREQEAGEAHILQANLVVEE